MGIFFPEKPISLTALLIDDEQAGLRTLSYLLSEYCPEVEILDTCQSSVEGLKKFRRLDPDLLFLDIQMPHLNGLEVLEIIGPGTVAAIFVTAYDDYLTRALRLNALDYLIKPVNPEDLQAAVQRAKQFGKKSIVAEQIDNALRYVRTPQVDRETRIGLKSGHETIFVNLLDICYCNSDGNFTKVILTGGEQVYSSYSLRNLGEILPEQWFYRCHREYIVNGRHINSYDRSNGGGLRMSDGTTLPISRGARGEFEAFLGALPNLLN